MDRRPAGEGSARSRRRRPADRDTRGHGVTADYLAIYPELLDGQAGGCVRISSSCVAPLDVPDLVR
jgi:hypothetical protein